VNNGTEMPAIQFSDDASFDTLVSVLKGWTVRLWFEDTDHILVCEVVTAEDYDRMKVKAWSATAGDYVTPLTVEIDKIRKVEVM
jgi:hypothetical protein